MKTFVLIVICGLSSLTVLPQSYHKLIRTNVHWDGYNVVDPEFFCYTSAERIYFTNQDTAINGYTYRISKFQNIITINSYGYFCPPFAVEPTAFNTNQFMREDTISKKVYLYTQDGGGIDQLFYDFSLNPGDTLQSTYYSEIYILDSIGNFYLNNGESRKIFWFHNNYSGYPPSFYIESIGNDQGLFTPLTQYIGSHSGYLCVEENSINLVGDICENYYVGLDEKKENRLSVFPNPSSDLINIYIPAEYDGSVMTLFNSQGVKIKTITLSKGLNSILVSNFTKGIYFYHIKYNNGLTHGKITIL